MLNAKPRTIDAAMGKWPGILLALGVEERFLRRQHGPCPFCGGSDRWRFDDRNGTGSFYCSQCGPGSGMQFVMKVLNVPFKDAAAEVDRVVGNVQASQVKEERSEADKVASIKKVLRECRPVVQGDPVWAYLNRRTGIVSVPTDIKFHPGLPHASGGRHPTMVAIMRDAEGNGVTLHRTYLTLAGEKASIDPVKQFMPGKRLNGAAVRLSDVGEVVGIAEGLETAMAASIRFQSPIWAATNAVLLESWVPPAGVKQVLIASDNDSSYTGQAAAYALARRLVRDGFAVDIRIPEKVDTDWADEGI